MLFNKNLTKQQKFQYLASASYYLSGPVVIINAILPLVFFFTGLVPLTVSSMALATIFLPYMFLTIYLIRSASNYSFTFRAVAFSMGAFAIHIKALWHVLLGTKNSFNVTSKKKISGNFVNLVIPHLIYILLVVVGSIYAISKYGFSPSVIANISWATFNVAVFSVFIFSAIGDPLREYAMKFRNAFSWNTQRKPINIDSI